MLAHFPLLALAACGGEADGPGSAAPPAARTPDLAAADAPRTETPVRGDAPGLPDEAAARGLVFTNRSGRPEKPTVLEANGSGVALLDLGTDGDLDVVFAQGLGSLEELLAGPGAALAVFDNDGEGGFTRSPDERVQGERVRAWWTGLAAGDLEGDGDVDLVAGAYGDLAALRQGPDGGLVRVPPHAAGLWPEAAARLSTPGAAQLARVGLLVPGGERTPGDAPSWHTSLALFDADRDGDLDLYAGRYLALDPLDPPAGALGTDGLSVPCTWKGHPVYCGPRGLPPQPDAVFEGNGDGTFRDRTATWLRDHRAAYTLAVTPFDADQDGDTDLHVANDSVPDLLLWNGVAEGIGLRDVGTAAAVAVDADGVALASMGAAVGDLDRDGRPDLAVTAFSDEPTRLLLARAPGRGPGAPPVRYADGTARAGLGHASRRLLSWSAHLVDLDLDGHLELYTANGHVYPQADRPGTGTRYGQPDSLWRFDDELRAHAVVLAPTDAPAAPLGTRGVAVGDVDGDGAPDLVLARLDAPAALALNRLADGRHRLVVRCEGPFAATRDGGDEHAWRTPRDGTGTRVVCVPAVPPGAAPFALLQEVQTARGYQSSSSPELVFGLGASARVAELTFLWPSGATTTLRDLPANRRVVVREGEGLVRSEALR